MLDPCRRLAKSSFRISVICAAQVASVRLAELASNFSAQLYRAVSHLVYGVCNVLAGKYDGASYDRREAG